MSGLEDIFHPRGGSSADGADLPDDPVSGAQSGPFVGTVAENAVDGELVNVTLGAQDDTHDVPAKWVAQGDSMPAAGDDALVVFDDAGDAWLVAWGTMDPATSGGVTDHGALTGLADDDHTQYHNDARGDARYYTQSVVDAAFAANATADRARANHTGTQLAATISDFATAVGLLSYTEAETDTLLAAKAAHAGQVYTGAHDFTGATVTVPTAASAAHPMRRDQVVGVYQPIDSDLTTIAGLTATTDNFIQSKAGAWASRTVAQVITDLVAGGLLTAATAASTYQPLDGDLTTIAGLTATTDNFMQAKGSAWASRTPAQVATDLAAAGLLTSAAAAAAYQPLDSDLTAVAGLTPSNDDVVQRKAGAWTNRTMAQVKTDLVLVRGDVGLGNVDNTSDANKPVSTATQTALNLKATKAGDTYTGAHDFTGATPTVPTGAPLTGGAAAASQEYVDDAVAVVGGAPSASSVTVTSTGIIIPSSTNVQQALAQVEAYVQNLEETFEQHHHDDRYFAPAAKIHFAGNQAGIAENSFTKLTSSTLTHSSESGFADTANNRLVIPRAGVYNLIGAVRFAADASNIDAFGVAVYVNGAMAAFSQRSYLASAALPQVPPAVADVNLAAGALVELYAYWYNDGSGGTKSTNGGAANVYLSASWVRPYIGA